LQACLPSTKSSKPMQNMLSLLPLRVSRKCNPDFDNVRGQEPIEDSALKSRTVDT
jgi:hypothetical protein